jgi:hypothetical protein
MHKTEGLSAYAHEVPVSWARAELRELPLAHVARCAESRLELRLSGALPDRWPLHLAQGLAARRINLWRGHAARIAPRAWSARLEVETPPEQPLPDFVDLALGLEPAPVLAEPPLLEATLGRAPGGELELEVHAWDAVGLLAGVLRCVVGAGLLPTALALETEGDCAFHQLRLVGADGSAATRRQQRHLARRLFRLHAGGDGPFDSFDSPPAGRVR